MATKVVFALSALALFIQSSLSQCIPFSGCNGFVPASTGGSFVVTSSSPIAPIGISVVSDNLYEGALLVEGNLPLLGSVAVEGTMGTTGAGAVSYGCGDIVGIVAEEGPIVTGIAPEAGLGYSNGFYGLGYGLGNGFGIGYGLGNGFGLGYSLGNVLGLGYSLGNVLGLGYGLDGFGNGLGYGNSYGLGCGNFYGLGYLNNLFGLGFYGFGGLGY